MNHMDMILKVNRKIKELREKGITAQISDDSVHVRRLGKNAKVGNILLGVFTFEDFIKEEF